MRNAYVYLTSCCKAAYYIFEMVYELSKIMRFYYQDGKCHTSPYNEMSKEWFKASKQNSAYLLLFLFANLIEFYTAYKTTCVLIFLRLWVYMLACNATPYPIVLDTKDNAATHIIFQVIYQWLASLLDFEIKIGCQKLYSENDWFQ